MARYIKSFENATAIQNAVDNGDLLKPYVAYDESAATIDWNSKSIDYSKMYFTIEALESGTLKTTKVYYKYSKNNSDWVDMVANEEISVEIGDKIRIKNTDSYNYSPFTSTFKFNVYGNIMSIIKGDNYLIDTTVTNYYFIEFFKTFNKVVDASNLILPNSIYTRLYDDCFKGCTELTDAPELPATTLASQCYRNMFSGCRSLTGVSSNYLLATTLASECYSGMFQNCTGLTTAPELPATTLAQNCYYGMFAGCTNLNYIKCLATDISAANCTKYWVNNVQTNSGTFVKNTSMNDWTTGASGIPDNWTVIDA